MVVVVLVFVAVVADDDDDNDSIAYTLVAIEISKNKVLYIRSIVHDAGISFLFLPFLMLCYLFCRFRVFFRYFCCYCLCCCLCCCILLLWIDIFFNQLDRDN